MDKGYKIKLLREKNKISQKEVAMKLGITQSAYSKMEACESKISIENCVKISEIIGITVSDILNFEEKFKLVDKNELAPQHNLIQEIEALKNDNRILLQLLDKLSSEK
jgi:transcriptional regulator with XRE-family HTH domain